MQEMIIMNSYPKLFVEEFMSYMYLCHFGLLHRVMSYDYMSNMAGVLLEAGIAYPLRALTWDHPFFSVFVLCLVCPMLPVSLDCPFLIAPSVFYNVYCQEFFLIVF